MFDNYFIMYLKWTSVRLSTVLFFVICCIFQKPFDASNYDFVDQQTISYEDSIPEGMPYSKRGTITLSDLHIKFLTSLEKSLERIRILLTNYSTSTRSTTPFSTKYAWEFSAYDTEDDFEIPTLSEKPRRDFERKLTPTTTARWTEKRWVKGIKRHVFSFTKYWAKGTPFRFTKAGETIKCTSKPTTKMSKIRKIKLNRTWIDALRKIRENWKRDHFIPYDYSNYSVELSYSNDIYPYEKSESDDYEDDIGDVVYHAPATMDESAILEVPEVTEADSRVRNRRSVEVNVRKRRSIEQRFFRFDYYPSRNSFEEKMLGTLSDSQKYMIPFPWDFDKFGGSCPPPEPTEYWQKWLEEVERNASPERYWKEKKKRYRQLIRNYTRVKNDYQTWILPDSDVSDGETLDNLYERQSVKQKYENSIVPNGTRPKRSYEPTTTKKLTIKTAYVKWSWPTTGVRTWPWSWSKRTQTTYETTTPDDLLKEKVDFEGHALKSSKESIINKSLTSESPADKDFVHFERYTTEVPSWKKTGDKKSADYNDSVSEVPSWERSAGKEISENQTSMKPSYANRTWIKGSYGYQKWSKGSYKYGAYPPESYRWSKQPYPARAWEKQPYEGAEIPPWEKPDDENSPPRQPYYSYTWAKRTWEKKPYGSWKPRSWGKPDEPQDQPYRKWEKQPYHSYTWAKQNWEKQPYEHSPPKQPYYSYTWAKRTWEKKPYGEKPDEPQGQPYNTWPKRIWEKKPYESLNTRSWGKPEYEDSPPKQPYYSYTWAKRTWEKKPYGSWKPGSWGKPEAEDSPPNQPYSYTWAKRTWEKKPYESWKAQPWGKPEAEDSPPNQPYSYTWAKQTWQKKPYENWKAPPWGKPEAEDSPPNQPYSYTWAKRTWEKKPYENWKAQPWGKPEAEDSPPNQPYSYTWAKRTWEKKPYGSWKPGSWGKPEAEDSPPNQPYSYTWAKRTWEKKPYGSWKPGSWGKPEAEDSPPNGPYSYTWPKRTWEKKPYESWTTPLGEAGAKNLPQNQPEPAGEKQPDEGGSRTKRSLKILVDEPCEAILTQEAILMYINETYERNPPAKKPTPAASSKKKSSDEDEGWHLGNNRFVKVTDFRGRVFVNIREYYEKDGELLPGKKGIALNATQWKKFKDLVNDIDEKLSEMA